ncbi:hypothetical protein [Marivirga lumbricoides]
MKVIHRFYLHTSSSQKKKVISYIIYLVVALAILAFMAYSYSVLILIFLPFVISIFAPFIDVPMGRKQGHLIYYSPLLLASAMKNGKIVLHGGTLFDYYFTLSVNKSERRNRKMVIYSYTEGMINLLDIWDEQFDDIKLSATAYFINPKTAKRLGFRQVDTNPLTKLLMLINYLPIMISYSIANEELSFPNVFSLKSYESTLGELRSNKIYLMEMYEKLKS